MYSLLLLGSVSFLLSLFLTPFVRNLFRRWATESQRLQHPIPRIGGIAVALAYVAAYLCLLVVPFKAGILFRDSLDFALRVLPAAGLIFLIGLVDDIIGLEPWHKLLGQLLAAGAAYWAGIHITSLAGYGLGIGLSTLLITAAKLRLPEYASRVTFTNLGLAFLLVLIIASVSSYAGIRQVLKIEPFDIFRG